MNANWYEIMKETPDPGVVKWLSGCSADAMFTTAICHTEILYGVRRMSDGQKRYRLTAAVQAMFAQEFAGQVLPFDNAAVPVYADIRIETVGWVRTSVRNPPFENFSHLLLQLKPSLDAFNTPC